MLEGRRFLYEKVYCDLKKDILEGIYKKNALLPSEREISNRFEVDRTTVRKALDILLNDGLIQKHPGVGTKIIYTKEDNASKANSQNPSIVGFIIVEKDAPNKAITQPFYADLFYRVDLHCKEHNANVLYSTINTPEELRLLLKQQKLSGVIIASNADAEFIRVSLDAGCKTVQIMGYNQEALSITYDSLEAGRLGCELLVSNGHNNIALITGPCDSENSNMRLGRRTVFHTP